MADDLKPLLAEMKRTNAGVQKLVDQGIEDDTPKSLLAGNIFEILNAQMLFAKEKKLIQETFDPKSDIVKDRQQLITGSLVEPLNKEANQSVKFVRGLESLGLAIIKFSQIGVEQLKLDAEYNSQQLAKLNDFSKELVELEGSTKQQTLDLIGNDNKSKSKEKENIKEEGDAQRTFFQTLGDSFTSGFKGLQKGISGLTDSLIGKVGFATVLIAFSSFLISKFPALAEAFGKVVMAIINLFKDAGKLFSGEMGIGEFLRDNFLTLIGLGLFAFKNAIFTFFKTKLVAFVKTKFAAILLAAKGGLTAAIMPVIGAITGLLLKFVAIPYAIIKGVMGFFEGYSKRLSEGGGFFTSLIAGLQGAIGGVFEAIGNILDIIVGFVFDMFGGAEFYEENIAKPIRNLFQSLKDLFTIDFDSIGNYFSGLFSGDAEAKYMGGAVAAGSPYIVGEKGPELFVPGASGSILPNGGMGGGAPIIVTNNNVSAPTNNSSHQHSNVSITDNQQEITGL